MESAWPGTNLDHCELKSGESKINMAQFNPQDPPALFMPPTDMAHDIYALSAQLEGFDYNMYQDIQHDQAAYDSFQRWPFLFGISMASRSGED